MLATEDCNQQIPHKHIQNMCFNPVSPLKLQRHENNPHKIPDKFQAFVFDGHSSLQCYPECKFQPLFVTPLWIPWYLFKTCVIN